MTPHERVLWQHLRRRVLGGRFRRQHVLGRYIADFVCLEARLVVEVDGAQHEDQKTYDDQRTQWLQSQGYRVLRFTNTEVWAELEAVLTEIHRHLHSKCPSVGSSSTQVPGGTGRPAA